MIERYFNVLDRILIVLATAAIFIMLLITTISVIGRYLFSAPIPDDVVFNELLIVVLVFLPFAYVQATDQHVYVTLFTDWLPRRWQELCKLLGLVVGFSIFALISYATWLDFAEAYEVGAYNDGVLELPEWPSRFAVFFGVLILDLRLLFDMVKGVRAVATGEVEA